jgi:hypothetical protein
LKGIFKNHNKSFVGGTKQETTTLKKGTTTKKGPKGNGHNNENSNSDSQIYGGDDGNAEFEDNIG